MPTALITGGSRGFGRALAEDLVRDGWSLVLDGRDPEALRRAAGELEGAAASGAVVRAIAGDVGDPAHRAELAAAVVTLDGFDVDQSGGLDLLVNNAGVLGPSPQPALSAYPLDVLEAVYRVNVLAPLGLVQEVLPMLVESGGTIVNLTSDAAVEPYEGWGGYGSSKAALEQLSNVLGAELPGVRVYWFDPGDMRTRMHQDAFPGEDISDRPDPATIVPALRELLRTAPRSGRYRAAGLVPSVEREPVS
jgi:NAD(P)-dependent dehydrogenase (short-subunit alcohol dehydrogenase family)